MIVEATPENIAKAAKIIREGGLVAFPTETVYGLGANAFSDDAVQTIFDVKNRPSYDPLIVHTYSFDRFQQIASFTQDDRMTQRLNALKVFWPGPLSVVLPKSDKISSKVSAGLDTVAVRIPSHPVALRVLQCCEVPVAAPSANQFGYVSPTTAQHVYDSLGDKIDLIIDGGPSHIGIESTVLSLTTEPPTVLRPGGTTVEQLQEVIGEVELEYEKASMGTRYRSPGMIERHYSPRTRIVLREEIEIASYPEKVGLIQFKEDTSNYPYAQKRTLSSQGETPEIAANLFSAIREFDKQELDLIVIDTCHEEGLGRAIMDRVRRAVGTETH